MKDKNEVYFAPQLIVHDGIAAIEFYKKAFGVIELRRWSNDDGTMHVAELSFNGALFHLREESKQQSHLSPTSANGHTAIIGVFVEDVDTTVKIAEAAGAIMLNPPQNYEYGFRQASIEDPFGHQWLIEKKL